MSAQDSNPRASARASSLLGFALFAAAALALLGFFAVPRLMHAALPSPLESFDISGAAPRAVEENTATAVERDYAHAWQSLESALETNNAGQLDAGFTGAALEHWQQAIRAQQEYGLSRRTIDHGHKVIITFYSRDGSSLEASDTADLEIQYREGGHSLSSERLQAHYLVLLTPAENSWKIRSLQELH
jgi:hypothetical protein